MLDITKPCAVFLDIDGTLMSWASATELWSGKMSDYNAAAIARAKANGHKILINTGRGYACLPRQLTADYPLDGYVTALGAAVEIGGETVYNNPIPKEKLETLLDYLFQNRKPCRFQGHRAAVSLDFTGRVLTGWQNIDSRDAFYTALGDDYVSKITVDYDLKGEYLDFLRSMLNVYVSHDGGEACNAGNNKASGMMIALNALQIPCERSVAMGDSVNDIEVLKAAGVAVVMGNAPESMRSAHRVVTDTCENNGVGKALETLGLA